MDIFKETDYKILVKKWIEAMPSNGRGQYSKLADAINSSRVFVSQVFNGTRHLNSDQAYFTSQFFGFNELQTNYFLTLLSFERAGTYQLKEKYQSDLTKLRNESEKIEKHIPDFTEPSDAVKAEFCSNWHYGAIRLLTSISEFSHDEQICKRLNLPRKTVSNSINFLLKHGLIKRLKSGKLQFGSERLHISQDSAMVVPHRNSWRHKAISKIDKQNDGEMFFSAPMTISRTDLIKIRKLLLSSIEEATTVAKNSKSEELVCLNIDWFIV